MKTSPMKTITDTLSTLSWVAAVAFGVYLFNSANIFVGIAYAAIIALITFVHGFEVQHIRDKYQLPSKDM